MKLRNKKEWYTKKIIKVEQVIRCSLCKKILNYDEVFHFKNALTHFSFRENKNNNMCGGLVEIRLEKKKERVDASGLFYPLV